MYEGFNLTGFNLIRVLMGAFAVNLTEAREVLAFFDSEMNPIASKDEINRQGAILIRNYAGGEVRAGLGPTGRGRVSMGKFRCICDNVISTSGESPHEWLIISEADYGRAWACE